MVASEITPYKPKVSNRTETPPNNTVVNSEEPICPQINPDSNSIVVSSEEPNHPQIKFESNHIMVNHERPINPKSYPILIDPGIIDVKN